MKKLLIVMVTLLLSLSLFTQKTYAFSILEGVDFRQTKLNSNGTMSFQDYNGIFRTMKESIMTFSGVIQPSDIEYTVIYSIPNVKTSVIPVGSSTVLRDNINMISIYLTAEAPLFFVEFTITLYDVQGINVYSITTNYADLPSFDFQDHRFPTYEYGYQNGYDIGYFNGLDEGYDDGYDVGLSEGINLSDQESYDLGYLDGSNDSFMASIKDWIVPAIIAVLFLGGAVSIIVKKREG